MINPDVCRNAGRVVVIVNHPGNELPLSGITNALRERGGEVTQLPAQNWQVQCACVDHKESRVMEVVKAA